MKLHALDSNRITLTELSLGQIKHSQAETPNENCCSTLSSCQEEGSCADLGTYLSGVLTCVLDCIYKLLAALGLYTPSVAAAEEDADEDNVREFIAWAKDPIQDEPYTKTTEAAKDADQWKAHFEQLSLNARRYVMREISSFARREAYLCVQEKLGGVQFEDESEKMFGLIEEGLNDLILKDPGRGYVVECLDLWLIRKPDLSNEKVFVPSEHVRGFLLVWESDRDKPKFTWKECFRTLPQAAKDYARRGFVLQHNSSEKISQLPPLPEERNSAEGREAYATYLKAAATVDELIYKSERDRTVLQMLSHYSSYSNSPNVLALRLNQMAAYLVEKE